MAEGIFQQLKRKQARLRKLRGQRGSGPQRSRLQKEIRELRSRQATRRARRRRQRPPGAREETITGRPANVGQGRARSRRTLLRGMSRREQARFLSKQFGVRLAGKGKAFKEARDVFINAGFSEDAASDFAARIRARRKKNRRQFVTGTQDETRPVFDDSVEELEAEQADILSLLGRPNRGQRIPLELAQQMAGTQFDPQIIRAVEERRRTPIQTRQNLRDIRGFFGGAIRGFDTARARTMERAEQAGAEAQDVTEGIMGALGGAASTGSPLVGAAGATAAAQALGQGEIRRQFLADFEPLLKQERANELVRETRFGQSLVRDLESEIAGLRGARAGRAGEIEFDIRQFNQARAQQTFENQLRTAQLGLSATAQRAALEAAGVDRQFDELRVEGMQLDNVFKSLRNQELESELLDKIMAAGGVAGMDPAQRVAVMEDMKALYFPIAQDPETGAITFQSGTNVLDAFRVAHDRLKLVFGDDKAALDLLGQVVRELTRTSLSSKVDITGYAGME